MEISKHSYGQVFDSLLDGIKSDIVVLNKQASKENPQVTGKDVFSSTSEETLRNIQTDEFNAIMSELQFAADRAKIALQQDEVANFVTAAYKQNMRGKKLEREAQKFCNQIRRTIAEPEGTTRMGADEVITSAASHRVISATCDASNGIRETSASGNYMGCIRNPNSIFDSDALGRFASVKHGDEKIAESKEAEKARTAAIKEAEKQEAEAPEMPRGITRSANIADGGVDQKLPANAMSIFSDDRSFSNIPEESLAEKIKKAAADRANKTKTAEAKSEWNKVSPSPKVDNTKSSLFD